MLVTQKGERNDIIGREKKSEREKHCVGERLIVRVSVWASLYACKFKTFTYRKIQEAFVLEKVNKLYGVRMCVCVRECMRTCVTE